MRKARFTEHQIIIVLKSGEAGRTVKNSFIERFNRTYRTFLLIKNTERGTGNHRALAEGIQQRTAS